MHSALFPARRNPERTTLQRPGFTLTEILVVIAIIAILTALAAAFVFATADGRRRSNTELTIQAVNKIFQHHWSWVIAQAKQEEISDPTAFANLFALSGKSSGMDPSGERTRVLWIKLRLMEAFPMRYSEVNNTYDIRTKLANPPASDPVWLALNTFIPTPPIPGAQAPQTLPGYGPYLGGKTYRKNTPTYQNYLRKVTVGLKAKGTPLYQDNTGNDPTGLPNSYTESSACLLMAVSQSRDGVALSPDSLAYAIADTDGDSIKELVDGWQQQSGPSAFATDITPPNPGQQTPLRFYRWAWNTNIQAAIPNAAGNTPDQVDVHGTLVNPTWRASFGTTFATAFRYVPAGVTSPGNPPFPFYMMPVIVSAGSDGYFGLPGVSQFLTAGTGQLTVATPPAPPEVDNIYSYNLKTQ